MLGENEASNKDKARMDVNIKLPKIDLKLSPKIYKHLTKTGGYMAPPTAQKAVEQKHEEIENQRTKLMAGNKKFGLITVKRKVNQEDVWQKHICILNGAYMHFFKSSKDQTSAYNYYIRNAKVRLYDDEKMKYTFMISNRYNTAHFSCLNQKDMDNWIEALTDQIV